jgi:hypothetical protein
MTTPATSPGRAFLVYSGLRLALVLMSALLSLVLLRRQRDAFTDASIARADERRAAKASRRARLDEPPAA